MSVLFPKVNKPREWDYRPIYYDKDKEARKEKLARLQHGGKEGHGLHRGSFREEHERNQSASQKATRTSRLAFWIALLILLVFAFYYMM